MVFLVLLIPVGVLAFALLMERLELRLHTGSVSEQDVEEFFDHAQPDEVSTFVQEGWTRALSRFRARSRSNRPSRRSRFSRWASSLAGSGSAERFAGPGGSAGSGSADSPIGASSPGRTTGAAEPQGGVMPGGEAPGTAQPDGDMKQ